MPERVAAVARLAADRGPAARPGRPRRLQLELQPRPRRRGPAAGRGAARRPDRPARVGPDRVVGLAVRLRRRAAATPTTWPAGSAGSTSTCSSWRSCSTTPTRSATSSAGWASTDGRPARRRRRARQRQLGGRSSDELDDELVARLRDHYADSDAALAELLGRDLPWTDRQRPMTRHPLQPTRDRRPRARPASRESMESGHTSSGGPFSQRAGALLQEATGAEEVLLTTSCTDALELSAMLLDLGPDDTVDRAVVHLHQQRAGLRPAGRPDPVLRHRAGDARPRPAPPRRAARRQRARGRRRPLRRYRLRRRRHPGACWPTGPTSCVVEDAAHGLYGSWRGEPLGGIGRFAQPVASTRPRTSSAARAARSCSTTRPTSTGRGCSTTRAPTGRRSSWARSTSTPGATPAPPSGSPTCWRPTSLAQLEQAESIQSRRRAVFEGYAGGAGRTGRRARAPAARGARGHATPPGTCSTCCSPTPAMRPAVMGAMREQGIATTFHYVPLHDSEGGRRFARPPDRVPGLERRQLPAGAAAVLQHAHRGRRGAGRRHPRRRRRRTRVVTPPEQREGSASIEQPDYWWYTRPRRRCSTPRWATSSATRAAARRRQRRRAERDLDARRPPRVGRPRPARAAARPRACRPPRSTLPFRDAQLRRGRRPSTWSSTASPEAQRAGRARARAAAGRSAAAVGPRLPVGLDRPRRPGRPPPALHPAAAGRRGRARPASTYDGAATGSPGCSRRSPPSGSRAGSGVPADVTRCRSRPPTRRAGAARAVPGRGALVAAARPAVRVIDLPGRREAGGLSATRAPGSRATPTASTTTNVQQVRVSARAGHQQVGHQADRRGGEPDAADGVGAATGEQRRR